MKVNWMKKMKETIKRVVATQQAKTENRNQFRKRKLLPPLTNVNRSSGFTLIEVLVSVAILSVGALGVVSLQVNSMASQNDTKQMGSCGNLLYEALDLVRAGNGEPTYGTTIGPITSSTACPGDGSNKDLICESIKNMGVTNASLEVTFEKDEPITGVDKVTARNDYTLRGGKKTCASVLLIRQRN